MKLALDLEGFCVLAKHNSIDVVVNYVQLRYPDKPFLIGSAAFIAHALPNDGYKLMLLRRLKNDAEYTKFGPKLLEELLEELNNIPPLQVSPFHLELQLQSVLGTRAAYEYVPNSTAPRLLQ